MHFHISRHQRQRSMVTPIHLNIPTTPRQIQPNSVCNRAYTSSIRVSNFDDAHRFDSCHAASSPTIVIRCFLAAGPHLSLLDSEVLLKLQIAKQVSTQSRAADLSTHIPLYRRLDTHRLITFRLAVSQVPTTQSLVSQCIVHVLRSTDNFGICNGKE